MILTHFRKSNQLNKIRQELFDIGNRIFEYGQSYVALSRVKSLDGLYLSEFNPERIGANPIVIEFYKKIEKNNEECN